MSQKARYLEKHGRNCVKSERRGCMRIQRWWKSGFGTMNQETAYIQERSAQAYAKLKDAQRDLAELEAKEDTPCPA